MVSVSKRPQPKDFNSYRPVALTSHLIKILERLVLAHLQLQVSSLLDPLQFTSRPNRSTDDAIATTLHVALTHLDNKDMYVRMLFIDFTSAFNTIIPQHLTGKQPAGPEHFVLQLDPGLSHGEVSDSPDR